jgi:hypothetical protein
MLTDKEKLGFRIVFMILVGTLFFMSINLISAEKINEPISINVQCVNSTYANITYIKNIIDSSYLINSENSMTKSGNNYNYTISSNLNNKTGTLEYAYHCDINSVDTSAGSRIDVTSTGQIVSLSNIIIVLVFLVLAGIFFLLGYTFNADKWIIKSFFFICSLLMGLIAVNSARIIASESESIGRMVDTGFILLIAIILFFFLYTFINWTILTFKSVKQKGAVRWEY